MEKDKENEEKENKTEPKAKKPNDKEIIVELTETLQRLQAEFENYKKRVDKEKEEFVKFANADFIQKLLIVIDTFEIALRHKVEDKERFVKGMEMIYAQLMLILQAEGLRPIDALEKKFDPYIHEVMLKEKSEKEDGIILEELQKGYMLDDRVLRHSKVKVSEKQNFASQNFEKEKNENH